MLPASSPPLLRMGDAARQFAALTFAEPGMPLIYSGQEVGNDNSLEFFMRDPIVWEDRGSPRGCSYGDTRVRQTRTGVCL